MKTYDLRNAGEGCIDNPALALLDVFAKREGEIQVIVKARDIPEDVLRSAAESCGYTLERAKEEGDILVAVLRRRN